MSAIFAIDTVIKHSGDDRSYVFNCTNLLATSELITGTPTLVESTAHATSSLSITAVAVLESDTVVDGVTVETGKGVSARISGGTSPADHTLTLTFSTDSSNTVVTGGTLQVRDS
jgi:hypothetical protein